MFGDYYFAEEILISSNNNNHIFFLHQLLFYVSIVFEKFQDLNYPTFHQIAVDIVLKDQKVSAAFLQRKLRIGYNTAIILLDKMEEDGIIGPATGTSTPRKILMAYADQVCPNCGNVVQDGYKFCTKCGNRIR